MVWSWMYNRAPSDRPPPYAPFASQGVGNSGSPDDARYFDRRADVPAHGEQVYFVAPINGYGSFPRNPNISRANNVQNQAAKLQVPHMLKVGLTLIISSWIIFFLIGYSANVPLNSALHDRRRQQWDKEESYRAITRAAWVEEVKKHQDLQLRMQEEQKAFDEMRRDWARERQQEQEERERKQRELEKDETRKRDSLAWEGLQAGHCVRYGVKEYSATLSRVPLGLDSISECQKKSINIQGRDWHPSRCEESGFCGRVTAHFDVDINESSCKPWWVNYRDKGCVEYGIRRHEASIEDLHDTENWESICMTTPMTIRGRYYEGPTSCANWGRGGLWPWGIWLLEDDSCRW
ncbi:hypothetical protein CVT26_008691 [Gymnopilus dilepis]|uniref:Uncharacterized protein n=1 Tax=Gymnopilus dilepis TaxID=231916 RepID=A0A409W9R7_9AGAR|nr:hypothetical protein CVT26_008691 [Gymnopilus dilepis]